MRDPRKKVRPEAKALNLTPDQQNQLFAWLKVPGNTLAKGVEFCRAAFNLSTSIPALCRFHKAKAQEEWQDLLLKTSASTQAWSERAETELPEASRGLANNLIQKAAELQMSGAPAQLIEPLVDMALRIMSRLESREALTLEFSKFREQVKADQEKGLDALFEEIKGDPESEKIFKQLRERVMKPYEKTAA